jgi:hypothetical protein
MEVKIGSKTYQCEKYGITELADLQDYLQEINEDKIIKKARKVYGDNLPDQVYEDLKKEISVTELTAAIQTNIRAMAYLIFLTIRKSNPNIEFEKVMEGLGDIDTATDIFLKLSPDAADEKKM